ncbi:S8 family serine peptidase [Virgibacillus oceani]
MRRNSVYQIKFLSLVMVVVMVFSIITPGFAEGNLENRNVLHDKSNSPMAKLNDRLISQWDDDEKVTFLVKFKETADTEKVVEEAKSDAQANNLSAQKAEFHQRSNVVNVLKEVALKEQQSTMKILEKEVEKGDAELVHSYFIVNAVAVTATKAVAEKIAGLSEVEKLLPNETRYLTTPVPESKVISQLEAVPQLETENIEWNVDRLNAPAVWEMGFDGAGTVVASIDTGVQWDHPALKEKYRGFEVGTGIVDHDYNWFDATGSEEEPYDDQGHGTHVTGTMVGSESDGVNRIGLAPGAQWIGIKAFNADGTATDADLLAAAEWVLAPTDADGNTRVDLAPDIVNNSWGGGPGLDEWYRDVVTEWRNANIFPVFAAGNVDSNNSGGPGSVATPANYPESFAVGALDVGDDVANFSLRGPSPYDEIKPDVTAPGQGIRSSIPGGEYEGNNGTSMAAPAVSGVIALLIQANRSFDVEEIEEILMETANPLTDDEYPDTPNNGYGYGLVDAENAVMAVDSGVATVEGSVTEQITQLPLDAEVSVQGKNRSVKTNPDDGSYMFRYAGGEHVLQAESYGYYTVEEEMDLTENEIAELNFFMEEIPEVTVNGKVTDAKTSEPIEAAYVLLAEDANVEPVQTNEHGEYSFVAYEGDYTLRVSANGNVTERVDVSISEDNKTFNIDLEPFYSYPGGELAYDDGTGEGGSWFQEADNAWGVRMSLDEGQEHALVTEGKFLFSAGGGDQFQVAVMDANGPNGAPGEMIAGPIDATAVKDGSWTIVDLRDYGILVEEEFYMVYIQSEGRETAPRLQNDKDEFTDRSWEMYKGFWYQLEPDFLTGNKMIRSVVEYEVDTPVISSPENGLVTKHTEINVEGTATAETDVRVMNNGKAAEFTNVGENGTFNIDVPLKEGDNELTAIAYVDGEAAKESDLVLVTVDTESPELKVDSPIDGDKTNRETATVEGTVSDENLDTVAINGQETAVSDEGAFSQRILLNEGENVIEVEATDFAGNTTTETLTIFAKYTAPEITNLTPEEDIELETGQSVMIEFESEPGLRTSFVVHMPLTDFGTQTLNATELPMMETTPGNYVGYYTVPRNAYAGGAVIEVKAVDDFRNETREQAEGRLIINVE